jgi:predicted phosphodiesterase
VTIRLPVVDVHVPGRELSRIATVNDVHLGERRFGLLNTMHEPPAAVPHAERCLRSALADAIAWGAQLLVVKGDLTHHSNLAELETAGELLGDLPIPVVVVPGNHETKSWRPVEAVGVLHKYGVRVVEAVDHVDLPGVRVVAVNTTIEGAHPGRVAAHQDEVAALASGAPGAVLVCLHHYLQATRLPTMWPPGIRGPEARRFLHALRDANPRCLVVSGHTHRHRRYVREGVTCAEVGSTKDYPGTWAGYVVHERGMRQVVHHVSDPSVQAWLDHTRWAVGGIWGLWSPGHVSDRCFAVTW